MSVLLDAIEGVKHLMNLKAIKDNAEAALAVSDLQRELAEVNGMVAELVEENRRLKEELKRATSIVPEVEFRDGLYYKTGGDGPFCTTCYDTDQRLIRVNEQTGPLRRVSKWMCGSCKSTYGQPS